MIVEYDCEVCGKHVRKRRSPANIKTPPRFCSQRCNGEARRGTGAGPTPNYSYDCESCGKACEAYRSPSAVPPRFCSARCTGIAQSGKANPAYNGGEHVATNGYVRVHAPWHPGAFGSGYVYEHRLVMEDALGRFLAPAEVVHHENGVKDDNRLDNLRLFATQADHARYHKEICEL